MELLIRNDKTIATLQQEFARYFPYLKLEFFKQEPIYAGEMKLNKAIDSSIAISELREKDEVNIIEINGKQKVSSLEKQILDLAHLHAQVYRKSGQLWLMTGTTDQWTLDQQNQVGSEMEVKIIDDIVEDFDQYHEQE